MAEKEAPHHTSGEDKEVRNTIDNNGRDSLNTCRSTNEGYERLDFIIPPHGDIKAKLMSTPAIIKQFEPLHMVAPSHVKDKRDKMMVYSDGTYTSDNAEAEIYRWVKKGLGFMLSVRNVNNILTILAKENLFNVTEFDSDKHTLNCGNGLLNINTLDIVPHTPDYKSVVKIPTNYIDGASCPAITKFIGEVVGEEYVDTMFEIAGFCLIRDMPLEKMVMFIGSGSNGKSVFMQLLEKMLGDNTDSKSLDQIDKDPYALAYLKDKLVNIGGDISSKPIENSNILKALTSREKIDTQVKYGSNISYSPTCKLIFSANTPPAVHDYSDGFWRRWVLVKFPNKFKQKPELFGELSIDSEIEGFLVESLRGLHRLLKNKEFSNSYTLNETIDIYNNERDSFYNWYDECVVVYDIESSINALYENYVYYCKDNCITTCISLPGFGKKLSYHTQKNPSITRKRVTQFGKKVVMYDGITVD